jgi:hypothetical protein
LSTKICSTCKFEKDIKDFYTQEKYSKTKGNYLYIPPECKECVKEKSREIKFKNKEHVHEQYKQYYAKDKQRYKDNSKRWKKENPDKNKEYGKNFRESEDNKDKLKGYSEKRKVKNHKISNKEWKACKEYFNDSCAYCGIHISDHFNTYAGELKLFDFHREHVDDQGANDLSNCVPSCKSCNSEKHTSTLSDWYNLDNPKYSLEREAKIFKWLDSDYKLYIKLS